MTKVQLHVMLVLYNVRMSLSNVMFGLPSIAGCLLVDTVPQKKGGGGEGRGYGRITHFSKFRRTLTCA